MTPELVKKAKKNWKKGQVLQKKHLPKRNFKIFLNFLKQKTLKNFTAILVVRILYFKILLVRAKKLITI